MQNSKIKRVQNVLKRRLYEMIYRFYCLFPLEDKVVGSSFYGKKYENNTRYIMEALETVNPNIEKVWIKGIEYQFDVPEFLRVVTNKVQSIREYATAKVWIDTHNIPTYIKKRKGQLFLYCYHAGLFQKKIAADNHKKDAAGKHNADNADIYISNSNYLELMIRTALQFHGPIWRTGLPKNDIFFLENGNCTSAKTNICKAFGLKPNVKIFLFAPTHRKTPLMLNSLKINYAELKKALAEKFGGEWAILIRLHPANIHQIDNMLEFLGNEIVDANHYPNMQELILGSDVFMTDYSSTIFDAAERKIPCFTYVGDYKGFIQNRELYFSLDDLPFPYALTELELVEQIRSYDYEEWQEKWEQFAKKCNLCDCKDSSIKIATFINRYIGGDTKYKEYLSLIYE